MKHAWRGTTDVTAAARTFRASARSMFPVELHDIVLPTLGYPSKLTLRWCDQPFNVPFYAPKAEGGAVVTYAGGTYVDAAGANRPAPRLQRGERREVIGVEVDVLEVSVFLDGSDTLPPADGSGGTPRFGLAEAILAGLFDGAAWTVRRLVMPAPPTAPFAASIANRGDLGPGDTSLGAVTLFAGICTEATVSQSVAKFKIKSALERASVPMPWRVFQAGCPFELYDQMCRVSRTGSFGGNSFQATPRVHTVQDARSLLLTTSYPTLTGLPHPDLPVANPLPFFRFGTLQFTDGVLAGTSWTVQTHVAQIGGGTAVTLAKPLPRAPAAGANIILQAGCDKTRLTCIQKFGNYTGTITVTGKFSGTGYNGLRFGGFNRVPPPDSAI